MKESKLSEGSKVSFDDAWVFILKVGVAAHKYGSTSTRLESFLTSLAKSFGYQGEFNSSPVEIRFGLRETPDSQERVEVMATPVSYTHLRAHETLTPIAYDVF